MKKAILFVPLLMALVGCQFTPDKTARQCIIDTYHSTEILDVPEGRRDDYLVRDTNGTVWYLDVRCGAKGYYIKTSTLLFDAQK